MKKIIPFKKEIPFQTNLYEVTSISLEHNLSKSGNEVSGSFTISGDYRVTESSTDTISFKYDIPFLIDIDDIYDITEASVEVYDFYYEILDNKSLVVNIEVKLDNVKEILVPKEDIKEVKEEIKEEVIDDLERDEVLNILPNITLDNYVDYKVYIVRDGDTVENIILKYNITRELLEEYNDLTSIKLGDKLIIPYVQNK